MMVPLMPWLAVLAVLLSALLTALATRAAQALQLVDPLEPRRLHTAVTPRGGGLGIALVMMLAYGFLPSADTGMGWMLGLAMAVTAGVGLFDDIRPLPAGLKALGQLLGVGLVAGVLPMAGLPLLPAVIVVVIGLLASVNVWNFMDGSNGMVASQGALIAAGLYVLTAEPSQLMLAAACLGFLPFNLPRARVFLGDVGSHAIGLGIGIGLLIALREGAVSLPQAVLLVSAFALDAGWTLALRILRREPFWRAHNQHLYQRAIRRGCSHVRICVIYLAWSFAATVLAATMTRWPAMTQTVVVAAVLLIGSTLYAGWLRRWKMEPDRAGSPDTPCGKP